MDIEFIKNLLKYHEEIRNIGLVAVASISFPFIIWRSFIAFQAAKTSEANRISEMFSKSIELLGAFDGDKINLEKRVGSIFVLEQTANNNQNYYSQVIHLLCSYIKLNSPLSSENKNYKIREDIQVAVTVIGRCLPKTKRHKRNLDLSYCNLHSAVFTNLDLSTGSFIGTNLENAIFEHVNMQMCDLESADLSNTVIFSCDFRKANLYLAKLDNSSIESSQFFAANLKKSSVEEIQVKKVDFNQTIYEDSYHMFNKIED